MTVTPVLQNGVDSNDPIMAAESGQNIRRIDDTATYLAAGASAGVYVS